MPFSVLLNCSGPPADTALHSVVDGAWSTACIARPDLFAAYRIELVMQKAEAVTRREYYFADEACDQPLASLEYRGLYELIVTSRDSIYAIDMFYDQQSLVALNAAGQELLEERGFCGRQNWPRAEAQNPLSFDPVRCTAIGPVPLKNFNLVQIHRGFSLNFGADLAHENERPVDVLNAAPLLFFSQPSP